MPYEGQSSPAAVSRGWGQISHGLSIRPLRPADLGTLMPSVGALVDALYPRGATKLLARLEAALNGYATAYVTVAPGFGPVALASETTKGRNSVKLSTFWVDPRFRGIGVGGGLLDHRIESWQRCDLNRAVVTVREERAHELEGLFVPRGFSRVATDLNKYGEGQNEVVLRWAGESTTTLRRALTIRARHAA